MYIDNFRMSLIVLAIQGLSVCNSQVLRVGCLKGKPPFVDVVNHSCVGLMADAFYALMPNTSMQYTMEFIDKTTLSNLAKNRPICNVGLMQPPECIVDTSDIPSILYHTANVTYDLAITFTYATSDRLTYVDTSIPLIDTYYSILLTPNFASSSPSILSTLTRQSVFYLIAILFLVTVATALVFFICESFLVETSHLLHYRCLSARFGASLIAASEQVFTFSSPLELSSPISGLFRTTITAMTVFLLAVFGALITSQLTVSNLLAGPPTLSNIRGARIGIQGVLLRDFLQVRRTPPPEPALAAPRQSPHPIPGAGYLPANKFLRVPRSYGNVCSSVFVSQDIYGAWRRAPVRPFFFFLKIIKAGLCGRRPGGVGFDCLVGPNGEARSSECLSRRLCRTPLKGRPGRAGFRAER